MILSWLAAAAALALVLVRVIPTHLPERTISIAVDNLRVADHGNPFAARGRQLNFYLLGRRWRAVRRHFGGHGRRHSTVVVSLAEERRRSERPARGGEDQQGAGQHEGEHELRQALSRYEYPLADLEIATCSWQHATKVDLSDVDGTMPMGCYA